MNGLLLNNRKSKGLCYNGKKYAGISDSPILEHKFVAFYTKKTNASSGSDQTTGYKKTFSFSSDQFKMYSSDDVYTELTYLPNYRFILFDKTNQEITTLQLVYDGSSLFHIEGSISIDNVYETSKITVYPETCLGLVDSNGNYFLSDTTSKLTSSLNNSSVTINYVSSTLTNSSGKYEQTISENITLPYDLSYKYSGTSTLPVRYIICSMSSNTESTSVEHYID